MWETKNKGKEGKLTENQNHSKSHDKKSLEEIECYHCGKNGHMRKDCSKWKQEKGKAKVFEHEDKKKSGVKIEEINVTGIVDSVVDKGSSDIFLVSAMDSIFLTAEDGYAMCDWILDSGASLHVSSHKEWFMSYVATNNYVRLGNEQTCDILGMGDVQLKF